MNTGAHAHMMSIGALGDAFRGGWQSPSGLLASCLAQEARYGASIGAYVDRRVSAARTEAREADSRWLSGAPRSVIDGIVFGAKGNIAVAGLPWHAGIGAYRERRAVHHARAVGVLEAAGAVVMGTLNMHEGALGATTDNRAFGRTGNPWNPSLTPGGSSGGSAAAVAAGFCTFSLGTDTMGSVRIPSAYCGIVGFKPTFGVIPREGVIDLSSTLDHVGVHARSAEDIAAVLHVFAPQTCEPPAPLRMKVGIAHWGEAVTVENEVRDAWEAAVAIAGHVFDVVSFDVSGFRFGALRRNGLLVSEVEGYGVHEAMLRSNPDDFSPEFRDMLLWGARQETARIETAYAAVRDAGAAFAASLDDVDVLMMPTTPQMAFPFDQPAPANQADFTCLANFARAPAISVPALSHGDPPPSVQFIAAPGRDWLVIAAAAAFEKARGPAPLPPVFHAIGGP